MDYNYSAAGEHLYAFYTRYPRQNDGSWPKEAEDLTCPKCGAQEIICPDGTGIELGNRAQCWICKHEFIITGSCWKWRKID